jgi:hypothetical protein
MDRDIINRERNHTRRRHAHFLSSRFMNIFDMPFAMEESIPEVRYGREHPGDW